jgi:esterase/lipase superfamily enzyme
MPEADEYQIRWTRSFMRADAEQPTGTLRMLLSAIRRNQWVLLERRTAITDTKFYPFTKGELAPRLEGVPFEIPATRALHLEGKLPSQTIESDEIRLFTGNLQNIEEPWLPRKVLLDPNGSPVAIGIPRMPRESVEHGVASETARDRILTKSTDDSGEPSTGYVAESPGPEDETPLDYSIVRIFYATDRAKAVNGGYSGARNPDEQLHLGTCDVTIPRDHRMGALESPRWWRFDFKRNPRKHITLQQVNELSSASFFSMLQGSVMADRDRSVLIFIHGFWVSFEDAARRTAQLSYDLGFKGAPILYSWPSAGRMSGYLSDEATIEWTKPHLSNFLRQVANSTEVSRIHIIAHSMGNRALVKVLDSTSVLGKPLFSQIVLTAPDIDSGEFLQLASRIRSTAERITLYASSNDKAISVSKTLHAYPRAGESGENIVVVTGLDTVDASTVDTSLTGHSYYAEDRTVLSDVYYLLTDGTPPGSRHGLDRRECSNGEYWVFRP